jgi:hypothetical protein
MAALALSRAASGSRPARCGVRRVSRVPKANASTWRAAPSRLASACRNITSARAYGSIEPETSTSTTSLRGTSLRDRQARSSGMPSDRIA